MGRRTTIDGMAALALSLAGCHGSAPPAPKGTIHADVPAPGGGWTAVVSATPAGGFRMGNPDAPVKLVEYASLSCPFCARFEQEGAPAVMRDVKTGRLSWEYRPYMNHPTDPAVTVLVHCADPQAFFAYARQIYATQDQWYGRVASAPPTELQRISALPPTGRNAALARLAGLTDIFRMHGLPPAQIDACLADPARLEAALATTKQGDADGINGTPNFFINGTLQPGVSSWAGLQPALAGALQ